MNFFVIRVGVCFTICICTMLMTATCQVATKENGFDNTAAPQFLIPDWMAEISDNVFLSDLSIPGTHNTMSFYGGNLVQCQTWPIDQQLKGGIRFLDIRVRNANNNLTIHHGPIYQRADFSKVIRETMKFLNEHPRETILMRVKEEFSETNNIHVPVVNFLKQYGNWSAMWINRTIPLLGQARGKLVILQDYAGDAIFIQYNTLNIADKWKVPTMMHINSKWQNVHEHLNMAAVGIRNTIFLTYSSGAGVAAYPNAVAMQINPRLLEYLQLRHGQNVRFGMIAMDFPSSMLIKTIIEFN
ncbi:1-phosphatidylinositol phosphodiesterase [Erpetoichthys calabaricus]|nr:1-phosphatidylinositol phosphodiesterase [Erpetoichthys calabaricus]XP_051778785.1 1-phosphatidylinositol phosphodiesterase [Erpetoichthys calabaricus]